MSASRLWQEEGGTAADVGPSLLHIKRCAEMGYPFCRWNDMTQRYDFLWLATEWREELTKKWNIFERYSAKREAEKAPAQAMAPDSGEPLRRLAPKMRVSSARAAGNVTTTTTTTATSRLCMCVEHRYDRSMDS